MRIAHLREMRREALGLFVPVGPGAVRQAIERAFGDQADRFAGLSLSAGGTGFIFWVAGSNVMCRWQTGQR
jgi:hypothetical protein